MSVSVRVLAPYVTLKVKDANGQEVVQGFYRDAVIPDPVEGDSLKKHLRTKMVEKVRAQKVDDPPPPPPADLPPAGNASREEWAAYAKDKKGAPDEETRPVEEGGLKQTDLRDKYGK